MKENEILELLNQAKKERKGLLLKADGTATLIAPQNGKGFSFKELYPILECSTIESREIFNGMMMLMDEEGKFGESVKNENASFLYQKNRMSIADYIAMLKEQYGDNVIGLGDESESEEIHGTVLVCLHSMS